jgi:hypothetical protein
MDILFVTVNPFYVAARIPSLINFIYASYPYRSLSSLNPTLHSVQQFKMDSAARQKARLQEIDAKKAKLEELRRKRELQDKEIKHSRLSMDNRTV